MKMHAVFGPMICASLSLPAAVLAQTAAAPGEPEPGQRVGAGSLEEVIVTTRRREEGLQDVPAAVLALSADQLESGGLRRIEDVQAMIPGLVFSTATTPGAHIAMRGAANRQGGQPPVGVFQDGIALSDTQISKGPIDVARVEVAKGPQSTLYGRATMAGAINLVTNNPTRELEGEVEMGAGMSSVHDEFIGHARGVVSGPIVGEELMARLVVAKDYREGFLYDPVNDWRAAAYDRTFVRLKLLWTPIEDLEVTLTGETFEDHSTLGVTFFDQPPPHNVLPFADTRPGTAFTEPVDFGKNIWDTGFSQRPYGTQRNSFFALQATWATGIGDLTSVSSYSHSGTFVNNEVDGTVYPIAYDIYDVRENRFSQEIRLAGGDRFKYLAGLYYLKTDGVTGSRNHPFLIFGPGSTNYNTGPSGLRLQFTPGTSDLRSYAVFAELGYDITEKLNLTAGARSTRDEVSGVTGQIIETVAGDRIVRLAPFYREKTFNSVTGSLAVSYRFSDDVLGYVSYSRGDQPGGFNAGGSEVIASIPFDPQTVDTVEAGLKSTLLDGRLRLNVALFNNDFSDMQVARGQVLPNGQFVNITSNAASANSYGADVDLQVALGEHWRATLGYSYLHAEIEDFLMTVGTPVAQDLSGQPILRSPEHSGTVGLTYEQEIGAGTLTLGGSLRFSSKFANDYIPPPTAGMPVYLGEAPSYKVAGLTGSYAWNDWEISGYVHNVFGEEYITTGFLNLYNQLLLGSAGEPRTFEISVKRKF